MSEYATSNLNVASYLMTKLTLDRVDQRGETVYFVFRDPQEIGKRTVDEFYAGATVCARDFIQGLKTCRDRLFELKRTSQYQEGREKNDQTQRFTTGR